MIVTYTNHREYSFEKNDCTVRALVAAGSIAYKEAHATLAVFGRKNKHGCYPSNFGPAYIAKGFEEIHGVSGTRVHTFAQANPTGSFILIVPGHAFALVDGHQIDDTYSNQGGKTLLRAYRKLTNAPAPKAKPAHGVRKAKARALFASKVSREEFIRTCVNDIGTMASTARNWWNQFSAKQA